VESKPGAVIARHVLQRLMAPSRATG